MADMKVLRVHAPAKINLSLHVLGVRADGYHELRTIFQSIALHDTLTVRVRRGPFVLQCDDPDCPADATNLVWRAAEQMWAAAGRRGTLRDVEIRLAKRVPIQAGLGGGSSDAAAALRVFAALWRVKKRTVQEIAASLGADVPYLLEGGTVLGIDRGDHLYPIADHPAAWVTLVLPPFGISTAEAYRWWDEAAAARTVRPALYNDLQDPVSSRHPEIPRIVSALTKAGAFHAAMSGSGSAVFGLFGRAPAAEQAARALEKKGTRALVSRTVNRAAYSRLVGIKESAPRGAKKAHVETEGRRR
jgi:4-diphosphocytidyl-2-C-methyl-D-erythritol kinase